ncbi:MAG: aldehyde dehydrogenase family protein, partial [Bacteroidales bacterium]|nr:aldehyde dehydrogenase family protein [Bacteroidales bacterium]
MQSSKSTQKQVDNKLSIQSEIDQLVDNAEKALKEFVGFDQEQVDRIVYAMALAGLDRHRELARLAHEETGRGVYEDKIVKNIFATEYIWNSIKHEKTVGVVAENEHEGYVEVAEPVGIVAGVTPVTNPTSTTMFKALICIKARNPIVFGFHPSAQQSSMEAAKTLRDAAIAAGAPAHCVQWIEHPSVEATMALMNHPKVSLILATGGAGMVRSAYSCGKPALGVGPGNAPCYIETSANVKRACTDLMMSKTFDNGMICASEQAVIVDRVISNLFEEYMKENGCYFLNDSEIEKVSKFVINAEKGAVNPDVVGKSAHWIAQKSGVKVPERTKILIARLPDVGANYPLSREKLSPVLA